MKNIFFNTIYDTIVQYHSSLNNINYCISIQNILYSEESIYNNIIVKLSMFHVTLIEYV